MDGFSGAPRTPRIGGQPAAYLAEQLRAFRSGERESASEVMSLVAEDLTDERIEDVAAWYASHRATPVLPEGFNAAAAPMGCIGCHGVDGIAPIRSYPNLAGNGRIYIESQLKAYRDGLREHAMMTSIAQMLTEEELAEVVEWYSSIGLEPSGP
jgi:cytochrome c553